MQEAIFTAVAGAVIALAAAYSLWVLRGQNDPTRGSESTQPRDHIADIGILPPIKREALTMKVEWPAFTVERWPNHSPDQLRLA